jgi:small conductance mechanosensitive channel
VIEISNVDGTVEDITIRTTVLRDLDGNVHHIPNGIITVTTNKTLGYSRINENIVVGYDTDLDKLEHVINHIGEEISASVEYKNKITTAPHFLRVEGFGDNGIVVKIVGKTISGEQWNVKGELYKRLNEAFKKHQIEIPYPHIVHVNSKK